MLLYSYTDKGRVESMLRRRGDKIGVARGAPKRKCPGKKSSHCREARANNGHAAHGRVERMLRRGLRRIDGGEGRPQINPQPGGVLCMLRSSGGRMRRWGARAKIRTPRLSQRENNPNTQGTKRDTQLAELYQLNLRRAYT